MRRLLFTLHPTPRRKCARPVLTIPARSTLQWAGRPGIERAFGPGRPGLRVIQPARRIPRGRRRNAANRSRRLAGQNNGAGRRDPSRRSESEGSWNVRADRRFATPGERMRQDYIGRDDHTGADRDRRPPFPAGQCIRVMGASRSPTAVQVSSCSRQLCGRARKAAKAAMQAPDCQSWRVV